MNAVTQLSPLEIAYYLSGPAIALIGLLGLGQLVLTSRDISTRSKREAATLAAQRVDDFQVRILPAIDDADNLRGRYKFPDFSAKNVNFSSNIQEQVPTAVWEQSVRCLQAHKDMARASLNVVNAINCFALYFTKGVADDAIGFTGAAVVFCGAVESNAVLLGIMRGRNKSFQPTIDLYSAWRPRLRKSALADQMEAVAGEIATIEDTSLPTIGVSKRKAQ